MSRFKPGDPVQFPHVRMFKGIFVTPASPKAVKAVREAAGAETVYDIQFLDAEGNPHVIPNVKESELDISRA